MSTICAGVYYKFEGPTLSNPFNTDEKSPSEVERALAEFPSELMHRLHSADPAAKFSLGTRSPETGEVALVVETTAPRVQVEAALAATLQTWDLRGRLVG